MLELRVVCSTAHGAVQPDFQLSEGGRVIFLLGQLTGESFANVSTSLNSLLVVDTALKDVEQPIGQRRRFSLV